MTKKQEETDEFFEGYRDHLSQVDELVHVVLNAHFDIEAKLDTFLEAVFFHPEHLEDARLTYPQKTYVARAYAELTNNAKEWQLMALLNSLRNVVAHGGAERKCTDKLGEMRKIMSGMGTDALQAKVKSADDKDLIVYAAALCSGFLLIMEEKLTE